MDFSDRIIAAGAFSGFIVFLAAHVSSFRYLRPKKQSPTLTASFLLGTAAAGAVSARFLATACPPTVSFSGVVLALVLYGLLALLYMAFIFGMAEAALRIRLLFELERQPNRKASAAEIYRSYNADLIFAARLNRLLGAGHLQVHNGAFRMRNPVLLGQLAVVDLLGGLMGLRSGS
ncbi:MAG: hypothetical protein ACHQ2Z_04110 [Elusimicrobiota bacterium]